VRFMQERNENNPRAIFDYLFRTCTPLEETIAFINDAQRMLLC